MTNSRVGQFLTGCLAVIGGLVVGVILFTVVILWMGAPL